MLFSHIKTQLKGHLEVREKVLVGCHCACWREHENLRVVRIEWSFGAKFRRTKEGHWWSRENFPSVKVLSKGNQVRGVLHILLYVKLELHDINYEMHEFLVFLLEFWGFLEIPQKPLGGLLIAVRRLLPFCVFSGFPRGIAWQWSPVPPGDASL